jgi:hypothetical protein
MCTPPPTLTARSSQPFMLSDLIATNILAKHFFGDLRSLLAMETTARLNRFVASQLKRGVIFFESTS